jgi:hypothetical protein
MDKKQQILERLQNELSDSVSPRFTALNFFNKCVGDGKSIYWIRSYHTWLKHITKYYPDIFGTNVSTKSRVDTSKKYGNRYYVDINNAVDYIYAFENGEL